MTRIQLKLNSKINNSYSILIEDGLINKIPTELSKMKLGKKYAIITDEKVKKLYGNAFLRLLKNKGIEGDIFSFPEGEKNKSMITVTKLAEEMVAKGFDRSDAIIALGGGVAGDIAGFVAAIYMRGIPLIQIPTTLLAMVDSAIGGKTGVDLESGKNLLGVFHHPKAVFIDPTLLKTLPLKQIKNGLAEVIKYGVIKDEKLFNFIEQNLEKILKLDPSTLNKIITQAVRIKVKVVEKDEKEKNLRMILNYGHTFGHAIERMSNFTLLHGYAISIGMVLANKLAVEKKVLKKSDAKRIKNLLTKAGLPITTMKKPTNKDLASDKKKKGQIINFILPKKIGEVVIYKQKCL